MAHRNKAIIVNNRADAIHMANCGNLNAGNTPAVLLSVSHPGKLAVYEYPTIAELESPRCIYVVRDSVSVYVAFELIGRANDALSTTA